MRHNTLAALMLPVGLAAILSGGCTSGQITEAGVHSPPGTTSRLDVLGPAEVMVRNTGTDPLDVRLEAGNLGTTADQVPAGQTRYWNPDGPRRFVLINRSQRDIPWSFRVRGASVLFLRAAPDTRVGTESNSFRARASPPLGATPHSSSDSRQNPRSPRL